jgi:hypothetical protein
MSYQLGIDFGTTCTAAAVRRAAGGAPEVVPLGGRGGAVSSVLHLARDGRVTVGEAAAGLAGIDPTRVVRELKRRVGHPEPVVLGGHAWTAEELAARLLRWVVDRVVEQEGAQPARIALAHPPSWAAHTLERLAAALGGQDLGVTFVAEPRAVAHAAAGAVAPGDTIAIHDLGGGRFDAAVLRRESAPSGGFAILGVPETIGDLGGLDLDELVWQHVRAGLVDDVPPVARVRRACTRAKETLSAENDVVVRIRRGEFRGAVRLDRTTFEKLIAPHVDRTVAALRRTIASAGLEPGQLSALLLVGGCARIPLVARAVSEQLDRVPTVHDAPDLVARGAVLALTAPGATADPGALVSTASGYLAVRPPVAAEHTAAEASTVELPAPAAELPAPEASTVELLTPAPSPARRRAGAVLDLPARRVGRRGLARTLAGVGAVIAAALVLVALFRPDGPLDPPLDPVAGDGAPLTAGPIGAPVPNAEQGRTEPEADPAVRPADARPSVTTTPPVAPRALPVGLSPTAGVGAGATAMTPPPPLA